MKIWKPFGLTVRDQHGARVALDDPRLDPLWATSGELGLPIIIHVADPVTFFWPVDAFNERWEQLQAHPDWQFPSPPFPAFETILTGFAKLVGRHPATTFIGAHVGCYAENLGWVSALPDGCPNFYVDISARINKLGRHLIRLVAFLLIMQIASSLALTWALNWMFIASITAFSKQTMSISTLTWATFHCKVAGLFTVYLCPRTS